MESIRKKPEVSLLRKFIPLNEWSNRKLEMLADTLEIIHAKTGETLIEFNSDGALTYYLVRGKVQLVAADGKERTLDANSPHAAAPLSQLLPHKCMVTCLSPVKYISIKSSLIDLSVSENQLSENSKIDDDLEATDGSPSGTDNVSSQLAKQLHEDLKHDRLNIPSLPEIATRVGRAIEDESCNANSLARIIQTDPAITAKIVKAANSAFYGAHNPVETCSQAIVRLGMSVTHSLVVNYTMRDLFQTKSKAINLRMHKLWIHSIKVAAICYVLAKRYKAFNADEAMAIGLLHDIGIAAILNQASNYPELANESAAVDATINELRGSFGSRILKSWRFSDTYVTASEEAENWMRDTESEPDYCDILILAQLHSYVGTKKSMSVPPLDKIPAIPRLGLGPRQSLAVLKGLNEEIEEVRSLLNP